ncbi:MAG: hypothetical protein LBG97_00330 [Coriobacteriales bacterium]|nr:hypothetical protein [Coriobacteriales bacterium]
MAYVGANVGDVGDVGANVGDVHEVRGSVGAVDERWYTLVQTLVMLVMLVHDKH